MDLPVPSGTGVDARSTPGDPVAAYLASLASPASRREMAACLDRIVRLSTGDSHATAAGQPWHRLTYRDTSALKELLRGQGWSAAHVNKHLVALRRVLTEAWRLGLMDAEQQQRACDITDVTATRLPRGHHIATEVIGAVLAACDGDDSPAGRRDAAIITVLYATGCRRAEIARLAVADYDPAERGITVIGKGDKQRLVHLNARAVAKVEVWLAVRGRASGAMFPPISAAGRIRMRNDSPVAMSGQAVAHLLQRRLTQAEAPHATPHDLRRTFIGSLLDAGVDLATTQQIVGHASPATTARYDRRPDHRRRDAIDRLSVPEARPLRLAPVPLSRCTRPSREQAIAPSIPSRTLQHPKFQYHAMEAPCVTSRRTSVDSRRCRRRSAKTNGFRSARRRTRGSPTATRMPGRHSR